jgi:hypothetical protein
MLSDIESASLRLTECDFCGSLARLMAVRAYYGDAETQAINGVEEEIDCPACGQRTQALGEVNC